MRTRSSSNLVGNSSSNPTTSNPKRRNRRRSNQRVEPFALEESPVVTMVDQRTMAELLRAPTEGYAEAIVVPPILAEHFELKHSLINMMTSDQFFRLEKDNPHDHIRWFNKITSTIKYKDVPNHAIKLMLFPFSLAGAARRTTNLRNEISNFQQKFDESFHEAWDRYKDLLRACPHHGFTELHQLDTFYNALNPSDQDSLNSAAGGNLLERSTQDVLTIIENKSKVRNSRNKSIVSQVKSSDGNSSSSDIAKLTHAVNQQTSVVTTAMTAILKQFQATLPPASVKAVEEICVTCGGPHPYYQCLAADGNTFPEYRDNIQGYVAAAMGNYNQGNAGYRPQGVVNQTIPPGFVQQNGQNNHNRISQPQGYNRGNNFNQNPTYQASAQQNQSVPLSELEKFKKMNDVNMKVMQAQINNEKNKLRNEIQSSIQASMSNQTNELKNMMASFFQMNTASTSGTGSLPSNTIANPKGELKAITTRSGLVLNGPTVPKPPPFINPEEDEHVKETLTDPKHGEYTIKVPPPQVQKAKPPSQRNFVIHTRDPRYPHIPCPSRMNQEKQKEKDEFQIHIFWQMFKQLHINISLADALILIPKYQKMLKSLLSNKEKLIELANTPLQMKMRNGLSLKATQTKKA
ncbi:reverse transcriptase domain-containing protein [Tanacetum coccineum]